MPIESSLDNSQRGGVRFIRKIFLLSESKLTGAYISENLSAQFYPKTSRITENRHVFGQKCGQKHMKEQSQHKTEARLRLSMPKNSYNNLLLDHIDGFEFFLIFWFQILSYLPLFQEGTTAGFPSLGSSHNRPCPNSAPRPFITQN